MINADICSLISDALIDEGHEVTCAADGSLALELACATPFDVVVADMRLPGLDGLALFRRLREESPDTDMILITGNAAVADAVAVLKEGAFDYLTKPIRLDELVIQLNRIASFRALRRDIVEARAELKRAPVLDQLIGHSPEMLSVVKRIETVANCDAAVLILGESGTGKELVARALHAGSERREKPFVAVNCAAFPDTLIEAELFGHERGRSPGPPIAERGASRPRTGTLFLDEVAELSTAAQAKLLRVLQEGTVEPLGSNVSIQVDVRIISATHQNLKTRVAQGQFREDLYYRINTIDLRIPPLRARSGDLAVLARLFIGASPPGGGAPPEMSWPAWNAVSSYGFPGNVRELDARHGARGAALTGRDHRARASSRSPFEGAARRRWRFTGRRWRRSASRLKEFERDYLLRVVSQFGGKRIQIAESLGISRKNLWEKLRTHGIDRDGRPYWVDGGMMSSPSSMRLRMRSAERR